mgnify:CR=1 FL=1
MVFAYVLYAGLILASGVGVLWGVGSLLVGLDRYEEEHAIRTMPVASLDSVAVGPAAVRGRVEPVEGTIGSIPTSGECVAYDLSVRDSGSDGSETRVERASLVPFDLVTDEGSVRVREAGFDFHVSDDRQWALDRKSNEGRDAAVRRFERDWELPALSSGYERLYRASYLCPGDEVYAYGTVDVDDSRADERDKPLELTGRNDLFFISDRSPDALLRERRFALAKDGLLGVVVATVSLAAFLWLTGLAQLVLGA